MNRHVRNTLIGTAATFALVAAVSTPALADTATPTPTPTPHRTLTQIQTLAKTRTDARETALTTSIARITAAKGISDADRSTILGTLNSDVAGMHTVAAKIAADTDAATAATDYRTIFTTYRVFAVAIPQSRFAATADRLTSTTIPRLTDVHSKLAADLAGKDASKSTPALQADLTDMSAQISAASAALAGLAAKSLAVTPADYNGDHTVLSPERSSLKAAVADLKKASSDAKAVAAAIK
jgi:hypothetical protein